MDECRDDCPVPDRRAFLRAAALAVASAMAALAATPREAAALSFSLARAHRVEGDEVSYPIPGEDGATIDRENEVILVRWKGELFAFALSCPHQNNALKWRPDDTRFQCPKHKSRYRPDGTFISGKATRNMDRFPIRRQGKHAVVDLAKLYESDKHKVQWAEARMTV